MGHTFVTVTIKVEQTHHQPLVHSNVAARIEPEDAWSVQVGRVVAVLPWESAATVMKTSNSKQTVQSADHEARH